MNSPWGGGHNTSPVLPILTHGSAIPMNNNPLTLLSNVLSNPINSTCYSLLCHTQLFFALFTLLIKPSFCIPIPWQHHLLDAFQLFHHCELNTFFLVLSHLPYTSSLLTHLVMHLLFSSTSSLPHLYSTWHQFFFTFYLWLWRRLAWLYHSSFFSLPSRSTS